MGRNAPANNMAEPKVLGKSKKELIKIAASFKIKGRSKMTEEELRAAVWDCYYPNRETYIPKDNLDSLEYLMLHPNPAVNKMFAAWASFGSEITAKALLIVARCHATTSTEESSVLEEDSPIKDDNWNNRESIRFSNFLAVQNNILYDYMEKCNEVLTNCNNAYYYEAMMHKNGLVAYFIAPNLDMIQEYYKGNSVQCCIKIDSYKSKLPTYTFESIPLLPKMKETFFKWVEHNLIQMEDFYLVDKNQLEHLLSYLKLSVTT
jgi:hypothetical protein